MLAIPRDSSGHIGKYRRFGKFFELRETVVSSQRVLLVMTTTATASAALLAYERLAPFYDRFTDGYDHDGWIGRLEALAQAHGLHGSRAFDVACGTGKSFEPLVRRGYDVWACDLSPAMVSQARRAGVLEADRVLVADMRELPEVGAFALVTCLDDAVNYLLDPADLAAAFASIAGRLEPDGLFLFDTNTLATYRDGFSTRATFERPLADAIWRGETTGPIVAGTLCSATIELGGSDRTVSRHVQRHHPEQTIRHALASAGLDCRAVLGQSTGGVLHEDADEEVHTKLVYVASLSA
ncbi:class I SAM-dependent methyltransferase [Conexibacter sp. JD483]|uniref:class I SAM-dependent DNA methyltransferase n=1 Tax=unclassified Conexibacter TaxID=2627773 RepID=UPI00271CE5FB|nr:MULTISPECIES: class I SAM-dependent methyltransferase [unclassified Conexibacter]MDO8184501.1 class I SAM-dependent methyltransferase [Conexibacter sp. CPCC 205706]MDO8197807.1 class I SAM-dependent methyltransferase [Conexibacter sp. CPCC 205762]MDR9369213.1 class I SAM-dependent methyltransferase [Conexibacter sp. JD483]